jgi:hypothetical protein
VAKLAHIALKRFTILLRPSSELQHIAHVSAALGPGVGSASNRNKYLKVFLGSRARPAPRADNFTAICEPVV